MKHTVRSLSLVLALAAASCTPKKEQAAVMNTAPTAAPAAPTYSESNMSPELRAMRDRWLGVKTPEDFHALLMEMEKAIPTAPADLKYFSLEMVGLKDLQGIVWRLSGLADDVRATNSAFLTGMLRATEALDTYANLPMWEAVFAYLTEPLDFGGEKFEAKYPKYNKVSEFQDDITNRILPKFLERTGLIAQIAIESGKPLVFDNTAAWGAGTFADNLDRFRVVAEPEKNAMLAARNMVAHNLYSAAAWNADDAPQAAAALGRIIGIDGFIGDETGFSAKDRAETIRKYPNALTLRANGAQYLASAFNHLKEAVAYARKGWSVVQNWPANDHQPLNSERLKPFSRMTENNLSTMERMVQGQASLRSRVTGEVVEVNLPAMYLNPPRDLKALLPTDFHNEGNWITNKSGYKVRNWRNGNPKGWNVEAFKAYLPGVNSSADLDKSQRILSQSWAGGIVAGPAMAILH